MLKATGNRLQATGTRGKDEELKQFTSVKTSVLPSVVMKIDNMYIYIIKSHTSYL